MCDCQYFNIDNRYKNPFRVVIAGLAFAVFGVIPVAIVRALGARSFVAVLGFMFLLFGTFLVFVGLVWLLISKVRNHFHKRNAKKLHDSSSMEKQGHLGTEGSRTTIATIRTTPVPPGPDETRPEEEPMLDYVINEHHDV